MKKMQREMTKFGELNCQMVDLDTKKAAIKATFVIAYNISYLGWASIHWPLMSVTLGFIKRRYSGRDVEWRF